MYTSEEISRGRNFQAIAQEIYKKYGYLRLTYRSIADLTRTIHANISRIPADVDLVIGIPRSGLLPATMIASFRHIPMCSLKDLLMFGSVSDMVAGHIPGFIYGGRRMQRAVAGTGGMFKHALIVDDCVSTGYSLRCAMESLSAAGGARLARRISRMVIYAPSYFPLNLLTPPYYLEKIDGPWLWEWNMVNVRMSSLFCVDIDGLLCDDPPMNMSSYDADYVKYISTAPLKFRFTDVGWFVSGRKESYRDITEKWLAQNNIRYKHQLVLRPDNHMQSISTFKGEFYKNTAAQLFIESNPEQCPDICHIAHKQVLCPATGHMYYPESPIKHAR